MNKHNKERHLTASKYNINVFDQLRVLREGVKNARKERSINPQNPDPP